ncbi:35962_t:CDS:2, partial [Racocetra persica]
DNSPAELTNHEIEHYDEVNLNMDECDSSSTSDDDMEITNNKTIELKAVLEKTIKFIEKSEILPQRRKWIGSIETNLNP